MKNIFKIRLHPLFYVVIVICFFTGQFHNFFLFLSVIIVHELGHILGGIIFKWNIQEVLILPFGALTVFKESLNRSLKEEFFIAILGPIFQILFYFLFNDKLDIHEIHYSLLFFNLMPIVPLDGAKILNIFFNKILPFKKSNKLSIYISIIVVALVILNLAFSFNFFICLILLFLIIKIWNELKNQLFIFQKFLYERYYFSKTYKKLKRINGLDLSKMFKDCRHVFYDGEKTYTEREILRKRFDFKGKL